MNYFSTIAFIQDYPAVTAIGAVMAIAALTNWNSLVGLLRKYPLTSFFTLALGLTWLAFVPYFYSTDSIPWFTFGPMVAAVIMAGVTGGRKALKALAASTFRWKVNPVWYLVAIGLPFATQYLSVLLNPLLGSAAPAWGNIPPLLEVLPMVALLMVFSGSIGEEIGWRGFALPRLLETHSASAASLIVGSVWAIWHLPLILVNDFTAYGAFMPIIAAFVFTWVAQNSGGSVLLAILMHASYQNSVRYLGKVYIDADHVQQQWIGVAIWVLMVAAILLAYGTRRFVGHWKKPKAIANHA